MSHLSRRTLLTGVGASAALSTVALPRAYAADAVTITVTDQSPESFGFRASSLPSSSRLRVEWTRGGVRQRTETTSPNWWSGRQPGYSDAQASVVDAAGNVVAWSPVIAKTGAPAGVPAAAVAAGMTRVALHTDFSSLASVDRHATGEARFDWFPRNAFGATQGPDSFRPSADGSHLVIDPDVSGCNWSLASGDHRTRQGKVFTHGYFEATFRFAPRTQGQKNADGTVCWPSFWLASARNALKTAPAPWGEIDIFEADADSAHGQWSGAVHQWPEQGAGDHWSVGLWPSTGADFAQWHTYGLLWLPADADGNGRAQWFLDGRLVTTWNWGGPHGLHGGPAGAWGGRVLRNGEVATGPAPDDLLSCLNSEQMALVIGTGRGWPMDVKSIRAWTR